MYVCMYVVTSFAHEVADDNGEIDNCPDHVSEVGTMNTITLTLYSFSVSARVYSDLLSSKAVRMGSSHDRDR